MKHQRTLVLGLGISGLAAAELASSLGARVVVLDEGDNATLQERAEKLRQAGTTVHLGWQRPEWPEPVDLGIVSPGIPPTRPLGKLAAALSCPVIGEFEFGARHCQCPILAITGTNGKTTTTELTAFLLKHAGKRVVAAGNVGFPLAEAARQSAVLDYIVAEVSSFQLETVVRFAPVSAAYLNLTDDHLDRYGDLASYSRAKLRIFDRMTAPRQAILRRDLLGRAEVAAYPLFRQAPPITFSASDPAADYRCVDGVLQARLDGRVETLLPRSEMQLKGDHNVENVLAALALCRAAGLAHAAVVPGVREFAPSAHRMELVLEANGVRYINDSKGTNPDAVIQALKALAPERPGRVVLLAGGRDKDMDFSSLVPYLKQYVKEVLLIGETQARLSACWSPHVPCREFTTLEAAVAAAVETARPGDTVLLSPACASLDMFKNYAERGNRFSEALKRRFVS